MFFRSAASGMASLRKETPVSDRDNDLCKSGPPVFREKRPRKRETADCAVKSG